jgi:hypothetical protein
MHCETLQVFTKGMRGAEGDRIRGGALGLGLMIGCATFAYGMRKGCTKAEILAIKDDGACPAPCLSHLDELLFVATSFCPCKSAQAT